MYLKFGYGRATQDAGIEISRGAMDRDQALNLVNLYENSYPEEFLEIFIQPGHSLELTVQSISLLYNFTYDPL